MSTYSPCATGCDFHLRAAERVCDESSECATILYFILLLYSYRVPSPFLFSLPSLPPSSLSLSSSLPSRTLSLPPCLLSLPPFYVFLPSSPPLNLLS